MVNGLLGKKVGMTQLLQDDGTVVPVTVIKAGPCVVVQKKTKLKDGYDAVQIGCSTTLEVREAPQTLTTDESLLRRESVRHQHHEAPNRTARAGFANAALLRAPPCR